MKLKGSVQMDVPWLRLNRELLAGGLLGGPQDGECGYPVSYPLGSPPLRIGENTIELARNGKTTIALDLVSLYRARLWIKYQQVSR